MIMAPPGDRPAKTLANECNAMQTHEYLLEAREVHAALEQAAASWRARPLLNKTCVELSARLRSSLGISYPERLLIRLSPKLLTEERQLLSQVVCHEFAHVVAYSRVGTTQPPHGEAWRGLMEQAGFPPTVLASVRCPVPRKSASRYQHTCQTCGASRIARKQMRSWRCQACTEIGLDGALVIESLL